MLVLLAGCASRPSIHGIPNLAPVGNRVWRGGEPTPEGWHWLAALGVERVITLHTAGEGDDAEAERQGMKVIRFPITPWQQFWGVGVGAAITAAEKEIKPNTYFHCRYGRNRTGTLGGWHRLQEGWTREQAKTEMTALGWGNSLPGLKWWFNVDSKSKPKSGPPIYCPTHRTPLAAQGPVLLHHDIRDLKGRYVSPPPVVFQAFWCESGKHKVILSP